MSTTITLSIDDDVRSREEYVIVIEHATTDEVISSILKIVNSAMSSRIDRFERLISDGMSSLTSTAEAIHAKNDNSSSITR